MPFTKSQYEQVMALVKAGDIDTAARTLRSIDDPKARAMLDKLTARYPDGPASDPLAKAKALIAQKDYDAAETELMFSDAPGAEDLLRKLKLVQSAAAVQTAKVAPGKAKPAPAKGHRGRNLALFTLAVVVIACGVIFAVLRQQGAAEGRELALMFKAQDLCHDVFWDDYWDKLSTDAFYNGCKEAARYFLQDYHATMQRCYDAWPDEDYKLKQCLIDGGAKFDEIWFVVGSKN